VKQARLLETIEEVRIIVHRKGITINIARILKYCGSAYYVLRVCYSLVKLIITFRLSDQT
jgi:hypothetical protein